MIGSVEQVRIKVLFFKYLSLTTGASNEGPRVEECDQVVLRSGLILLTEETKSGIIHNICAIYVPYTHNIHNIYIHNIHNNVLVYSMRLF